jgi:hypothetical protein
MQGRTKATKEFGKILAAFSVVAGPAKIPESPKLGRSAATVVKWRDSSGTTLSQERRVCGKPDISSTVSPLLIRSNAIFFASPVASIVAVRFTSDWS